MIGMDTNTPLSGVEAIALERQRQIEKEGFSTEHDKLHIEGQLAYGAICYASPAKDRRLIRLRGENNSGFPSVHLDNGPEGEGTYIVLPPSFWPFESSAYKPDTSGTIRGRMRDLEKAGAMIAAEYDRLRAMLETN